MGACQKAQSSMTVEPCRWKEAEDSLAQKSWNGRQVQTHEKLVCVASR